MFYDHPLQVCYPRSGLCYQLCGEKRNPPKGDGSSWVQHDKFQISAVLNNTIFTCSKRVVTAVSLYVLWACQFDNGGRGNTEDCRSFL